MSLCVLQTPLSLSSYAWLESRPVEVAMNQGMLHEGLLGDHGPELVWTDEVVVPSIHLPGPGRPGGVADARREERMFSSEGCSGRQQTL